MPLPVASGLIATHVTVVGAPPIGRLKVPLDEGFTVLLGKNGAGKSTVLRAVAQALSGRAPAAGDVRLHCRVGDRTPDSEHNLALIELAAQMVTTTDDGFDEWARLIGATGLDGMGESHEFEALVDKLRWKLATIVSDRLGETFFDPAGVCVTLVPTGSKGTPSWEAFVSAELPENTTDVAAQADPLPRRSPAEADPLESDIAEFANAGLDLAADVVRVQRIGHLRNPLTLAHPLWLDDDFDVDGETQKVLLRNVGTDELIDEVLGGSFEPGEKLEHEVARLTTLARAVTKSLVPSVIAKMTLTLTHPGEWPTQRIAAWSATDEHGAEVPVGSLGGGARRWARLAIAAALADRNRWTGFLLVDEPEQALHPSAQKELGRALAAFGPSDEIGDIVIVGGIFATHSPHLLNPGLCRRSVVRNETGHTSLMTADPAILSGAAEAVGLTEADLLQSLRTVVLVEGPHDLEVFSTLFADELTAANAVIEPMFGAKKVLQAMELRLLFEHTDIRVRVVLDAIGDNAALLWAEAAAAEMDDPAASRRALERLGRLPGGEPEWLSKAGLEIFGRGWLHRIDVVGLDRPDIIDYLPVGKLVPTATSWSALRSEYEAVRPMSSDGRRLKFKQWLAQEHSARITTETIRSALADLDDLADLPKVIQGL